MLKKILSALFIFIAAAGALAYYASRVPKKIVIERTFNDPVESVWALFASADEIKKWWGPNGYYAPVVESDLRVGGEFFLGMQADGGKPAYNVGKYTEVIPLKRIASTLTFADGGKKPVPASHYNIPGEWPAQTTVLIEFSVPAEGQTHVKITEEGIPMIMSVPAKMGWEQQLDKIDALMP